jgi:hypothetical protein
MMPSDTRATLLDLWALRLPLLVYLWGPALADALADGSWLAKRQRIATISPVVAFVVGMLTPLPWPVFGITFIYTESLTFLVFASAAAILSGTLGLSILMGYVMGDLLFDTARQSLYAPAQSLRFPFVYLASRVVGYLFLAILVYRLPHVARRLTHGLLLAVAQSGRVSAGWHASVYAATCAMLVYLWCQGMVVMIRPVFTWVNLNPSVDAVAPVQVGWRWLVGAAIVVAVTRVLWERTEVPDQASIDDPYLRVRRDMSRLSAQRARTRSTGMIVIIAGVGTTMLAGMYVNWLDAAVAFITIVLLMLWQTGRFGRLPALWVTSMHRVPALLRFIGVVMLAYIAGNSWLTQTWRFDSFRPVLALTLGAMVTFCLVFPRPHTERERAGVAS